MQLIPVEERAIARHDLEIKWRQDRFACCFLGVVGESMR